MSDPRDDHRRDGSPARPATFAEDVRRAVRAVASIHPLIPLGILFLGVLMLSQHWSLDDVRGPFYTTLGKILLVIGAIGYLAGEVGRRWRPRPRDIHPR